MKKHGFAYCRTRLRLRRFAKDRSGVVAIYFALTLMLPLVAIGGGIDFKRWFAARQALSSALDSAVLAGARTYQMGATKEKTRRIARRYLAVNLPPKAPKHTARFMVREHGHENIAVVEGVIETSVTTTLLRLIGIDKLPVHLSADAAIDLVHTEVAAMLDLSSSMDARKLASLKTAAKVLVRAIVKEDQNHVTSRVGLVPFARFVNVGPGYFLRVTGPGAKLYTLADTQRGGGPRYTCIKERDGVARYTDDPPGSGSYFGYYGAGNDENAGQERHNIEKGEGQCIIQDTIVPLTDDKDRLLRVIDGLQSARGTSGQIGTQWVWYLLSPKWNSVWPAASAARPYPSRVQKSKRDVKKIAILMTDGNYTVRPRLSKYKPSRQAVRLCTKMKEAGIMIYTVGFRLNEIRNSAFRVEAKQTLRECATSPSTDFQAGNRAALIAAFKEIAAQINSIRLAK